MKSLSGTICGHARSGIAASCVYKPARRVCRFASANSKGKYAVPPSVAVLGVRVRGNGCWEYGASRRPD